MPGGGGGGGIANIDLMPVQVKNLTKTIGDIHNYYMQTSLRPMRSAKWSFQGAQGVFLHSTLPCEKYFLRFMLCVHGNLNQN
jgi:hypothetical protein